MRRALILITLLCAFSGTVARPLNDPARPLKSTTGAVLRSLAIPGWGQFYTENYFKSAAFLISETTFLINISRNSDWLQSAKSIGDLESAHFYRNNRNKLIWWFAAVKLLSLGDSYVNAQLHHIDISPELTPRGEPVLRFSFDF
ncbi:hypothetical protein IT157_05215 [bacterium]|nr:hypothetical protein [bacterium]